MLLFKLDLADSVFLLKGTCLDVLPEMFPVQIDHVDEVLLMVIYVDDDGDGDGDMVVSI